MNTEKHYFFIDDSGSKNWDTPFTQDFVDNPPARTEQNLDFWRKNYFVLGGFRIDTSAMADLDTRINKKKEEVFGTKYVEIHSTALRLPKNRKKEYINKFHISEEELRNFVENFWYPLFDEGKMQLFAVVVDKRYYKKFRPTRGPLEIAVETLFDRNELNSSKECTVIFDQMEDEIRSSKCDQGKVIKIADTKIDLGDGKFADKYHHVSLSFEKSEKSNFLQLADMVAYNVWRQFVDFGDEWDIHDYTQPKNHRKLKTYDYFERISNYFLHSDNDKRVNGYGIIKLPDPWNGTIRNWHLDDYLKKDDIDPSKNHLA